MIRAILFIILFALLFRALSIVIGSAMRAARTDGERRPLPGEEMVLDPECRTYVLKGRAVARTSGGVRRYFCSEECARKHDAQTRS